MIKGDQTTIAKETGRRLGMDTNMYPYSSLLGEGKNEASISLPTDKHIKNADSSASVSSPNI